jgi:hypothetical protein
MFQKAQDSRQKLNYNSEQQGQIKSGWSQMKNQHKTMTNKIRKLITVAISKNKQKTLIHA